MSVTTTTKTNTTEAQMSKSQTKEAIVPPQSMASVTTTNKNNNSNDNNTNNTTNISNNKITKKNKKNKNGQKQLQKIPDFLVDSLDCDLIDIPSWIISLMENQPILNIMSIGDVSHGKSTLMWALSGEKTGKHSKELQNNMTIKLGYTSCKIFKCLLCLNNNNNNNLDTIIPYFSDSSKKQTNNVICPYCHTNNKKYWKLFKNNIPKDKQIIGPIILVRHISFVDCPGHAALMGTMISAVCVADGAMMVIDASRSFPGKQTVQHMSAAHLLGVLQDNDNDEKSDGVRNNNKRVKVVVAQNKIDLITEQKACVNVQEIRKFLGEYDLNLQYNAPIIPISAQSRINLDALCLTIVKRYPMFSPQLLTSKSLLPNNELTPLSEINVIRSFDVNKPRVFTTFEDIDTYQGGVLGGVIINGNIKIGDIVTIRPGIIKSIDNINGNNDDNSNVKLGTIGINNGETGIRAKKERIKQLLKPRFLCFPIKSKVIGLQCGIKKLDSTFPGANVGIQLNIDPCVTIKDRMVGHIISNNNNQIPIFGVFVMSYVLLSPYNRNDFIQFEEIKINIGSNKLNGIIVKKRVCLEGKRKGNNNNNNNDNDNNGVMVVLESPICANIASKVAITRKINKEWKLAAGGIIHRVREIVNYRT